MDVGTRIANLRHAMAEVRHELRLLGDDTTVTHGDLRDLVSKIEALEADVADAMDGLREATVLEVEDLVEVQRYVRLLNSDVDKYVRSTLRSA